MVNVLRRELRTVITGRVLRQGFLHILEHIDVVHDDAAGLAGIHAVGAGDGLHERVPLHRFVQIERGQVLHLPAGAQHLRYSVRACAPGVERCELIHI